MIVTFWLSDDVPDSINVFSKKIVTALRDSVSIATCACSELNLELYTLNKGSKALYAPQSFEKSGYYPVYPERCLSKAMLLKAIPKYIKRSNEERQQGAALLACLYGLEGTSSPKHVRSRFVVTYNDPLVLELGALWGFKVLDLSQKAHREKLKDITKQLRKTK